MTPEDIAKKIVNNPNGYKEDSVSVAAAYLKLCRESRLVRYLGAMRDRQRRATREADPQ